MKKIIIIALLLAFTSVSYSQMGMMLKSSEKPFTSTWNTANTSTGSTDSKTIELPLILTGQYNFVVDWGDGNTETITTNSAVHIYATAGTKTITISGLINGWRFNSTGDKNKIHNISKWGCLQGAGNGAFSGCINLKVSATDALNTEGITDFSFQFYGCIKLPTLDVSKWDVSKGTNFGYQFYANTDLTSLDVSNWDVSSGTNFRNQFSNCYKLISLDISSWDVSKGTNFSSQFYLCKVLAALDVSNWDVSKGDDFSNQFAECVQIANLDVSNWDVGSGTNFSFQFFNCLSLTTLDVSDWDVSSGTDFIYFMYGVTMTTDVYNQTLINWDALTLQSGAGENMDFGNSKYSTGGAAEAARTNIINNDGWDITDGGGI